MKEPSKILFSGDWHGNEFWATGIIKNAAWSGADTILQAGDYGYDFDYSFRSIVEQTCTEWDVMVYFVDGNHDDHNFIWRHELDEDGFYVISDHVRAIPRGKRWQWWGKTFLGLGGAVSVDKSFRTPYIEWWPTETITLGDMQRAVEGGKVDVMVTHDCPAGVKIPGIIPGDYSQWPKQQIIEAEHHREQLWKVWDTVRPDLLVHGHYHIPYETEYDGTHVIGLDCDGTTWNRNVYIANGVEDLV